MGILLICLLALAAPFWVGGRVSFTEQAGLLLLLICLTLWTLPFSAAQDVIAFVAALSLGLTSFAWFISRRKLEASSKAIVGFAFLANCQPCFADSPAVHKVSMLETLQNPYVQQLLIPFMVLLFLLSWGRIYPGRLRLIRRRVKPFDAFFSGWRLAVPILESMETIALPKRLPDYRSLGEAEILSQLAPEFVEPWRIKESERLKNEEAYLVAYATFPYQLKRFAIIVLQCAISWSLLIILPAYLLFPQWPERPTPYVLFVLLSAPGYLSFLRLSFFSLSFCRTPGGLYVKALSKCRFYNKLLFERRFAEGSDVLVDPIVYARCGNGVSLMHAIIVSPPEGDDIRSFGYLSERTAKDRKTRLEAFLKNAKESDFMLTGQEPQWAALGLMWGGAVLALIAFILGI